MYIHTFEVSSILTNKAFYNIQNILRTKDISKWEGEPEAFIYWGLSDKGILIHMFRIKKKGYYSYSISYRISARRVIDNDNFVGLFNINGYPALEKKVNKLLKEECNDLPKLKKCKLKRLDFCVNTELESQEEVKAYIKTCKRSNIPSKLELRRYYDYVSKRQKCNKDDYTVYSSKYVEVSIYNKYAQMTKEKIGVFPEKEIERAKNIVRIEIRCMEGKIKVLQKKYNIESISDFMMQGNKIGEELFEFYLRKMFGEGKICTLKEAVQNVKLSGLKKENQDILIEFLEEANLSRSVADTIRLYKNLIGKTEVKRIIYMLDLIDTNYVTITNKDCEVFENNYIPTPYELYQDFVN